MSSYAVTLHEFPEVPEKTRHIAEGRYRQVLERALGGEGGVLLAYRAWRDAVEDPDSIPRTEEIALAKRWLVVTDAARVAGFSDLGARPEAYFEVRVEQ